MASGLQTCYKTFASVEALAEAEGMRIAIDQAEQTLIEVDALVSAAASYRAYQQQESAASLLTA